MPHKHKRDKSENKAASDLPPTTLAAPLPVSKSSTTNSIFTASAPKKSTSKRKRAGDATDDTPRAFARLMAWSTTGARPPSSLDDGVRQSKKKRKLGTSTTTAAAASPSPEKAIKHISTASAIPQILPGERMSDFSARVDAALPISGLISKGKKVVGVKDRKTKTEKRMQRMQAEWREVEAKHKQKEEEARDEAFVEESEHDERVPNVGRAAQGIGRGKKKGKSRKAGGGDSDDDDDPWAAIAAKRKEESVNKGLVGLHDVVQAPPQFSKKPTEKFKVRNGAGVRVGDVPGKAGSLRRREELGETRRAVVEGYRRLMGERREGVGVGVGGGG